MNCWEIRIYFTKSRFSLNGGLFVYMELLSGHEKFITKSGISLNAGTLNRVFTVVVLGACIFKRTQIFWDVTLSLGEWFPVFHRVFASSSSDMKQFSRQRHHKPS
jgi:hypothetical protein